MSKYLELVEVSEGVVVLRRSDQKDAPLVKIEFSKEVKNLLRKLLINKNDTTFLLNIS